VLGLAGPVVALIRQPAAGWGSPEVWAVGLGGLALLGLFLAHEARTPHPMLPLGLFARRNFAIGNLETFVMYGGMGALFFFLTLFLQQVAGYDALEAGLATIPTTVVMFAFSRSAGRLADRFGPRAFMGGGPLLAGVGLGLLQRVDADLNYWTDLLPALLVFSAGLVCTVAPLTATVLADADEHNAGIASAVNNAIARVAGLVCVAALGAVVAAQFNAGLDARLSGRATPAVREARRATLARVPGVPAVEEASEQAFHLGVGIAALMVGAGGVLGLAGIRNPRREVRCADCAEGAPGVHAPPLGRREVTADR
jgi:predicted MFS family arabinose efflux permease